ncbi:unnamed protein product [Closterium sp. NIES-54]
MPTRKINSVRKVGTPSVSQAAKAALRGVWETTHLPTTSAGAKNARARTCTPRPPTPSVPLTKLLNRRGLTGAQLLLTLGATKASTPCGRTATSTTSSATSTTATAAAAASSSATAATAATAATDAPTPGTTPTTTYTSSTSSTAASTAPSTTPDSLALASAALPTRGKRSADLLSANEVDSSSRVNRGEKGDRGTPLKEGEFSSDLLRDFCRGEGITQSFTLPESPQQNGIVERRIGLVMEVARTCMIHVAAPHFLWPFVVRYAAHQLNLWPRVSLPETSPTLRWTGKVGDASVFRVWGSRAFVRDTSADKLSARAIPCVFLGFVPDAPGWQFYHPTSRRVLPSQDVTFDESVSFYRLFPYRSAPSPPPPLFLAPGPPPVDPLPPQGPAPFGVSQVDPLPGTAPVQVAVGSGAAPGAASGGAASGGAEPGGAGSEGAGSGGAEPEGVEPEGAESEGAESGGAEPRGAALSGGPAGASSRLSSQQLREWLVQCAHRRSGAPGGGEPGGAGAGGGVVTTGVGDPTEPVTLP